MAGKFIIVLVKLEFTLLFFHFFSSLGLLSYGKSSCKNCKYVVDRDVNYSQKIFITFLSDGRTTQQ